MKKILLIGSIFLLLCSCGGKKSSEKAAPTTGMPDPEAVMTEVTQDTLYYLTADSIGGVKVGEMISDLPAIIPGLYDMMYATETPDAMAYIFLLEDVPQFTVYDFMEGKVDVIALEGDACAVMTEDGPLRVGDEFSKVLKLKGVESEWESLDDTGIWYWKWNGLYFGVDETGLSESMLQALSEGHHPPRASSFNDNVKVGYIATGLPF